MASQRFNRNDDLIVENHPKSPIAEAFRSIRTSLNYLDPDNPIKTLLITSSKESEGKSLITTNLALTVAQNNKKVIIIDADMRKPMQHRFFDMTNFSGLSNILMHEISFEEGLRKTQYENISLISTGVIPPNPAELLDSNSMDDVIKKAKESADMIFIDAPPVSPVTDAALLSKKTDGVLMVVASHETDKELLKSSIKKLEFVNANIIGTVLNKYPLEKNSSYNKYYYYYGSNEKM